MTDSADLRRTPAPFDDRTDPPMMADERTCLEAWLELYRTTVAIKLAALSAEQLCQAPVANSNLTLLGLVRHLTEVEQYWFGTVAAGLTLPSVYCAHDRDGDFTDLDPSTAFDDLARFDEEVVAARSRARGAPPGQRTTRYSPRAVGQSQVGLRAHDRGVRPARGPCRPDPGIDRRDHRLLTRLSRCRGGRS
jgi:hypothetical protein